MRVVGNVSFAGGHAGLGTAVSVSSPGVTAGIAAAESGVEILLLVSTILPSI
jgi:hypothetical protein